MASGGEEQNHQFRGVGRPRLRIHRQLVTLAGYQDPLPNRSSRAIPQRGEVIAGGLELYNLEDDIAEQSDLTTSNPEKTRELHARLRAWRVATKAPVPTEKNPKFNAEAESKAIAKARK